LEQSLDALEILPAADGHHHGKERPNVASRCILLLTRGGVREEQRLEDLVSTCRQRRIRVNVLALGSLSSRDADLISDLCMRTLGRLERVNSRGPQRSQDHAVFERASLAIADLAEDVGLIDVKSDHIRHVPWHAEPATGPAPEVLDPRLELDADHSSERWKVFVESGSERALFVLSAAAGSDLDIELVDPEGTRRRDGSTGAFRRADTNHIVLSVNEPLAGEWNVCVSARHRLQQPTRYSVAVFSRNTGILTSIRGAHAIVAPEERIDIEANELAPPPTDLDEQDDHVATVHAWGPDHKSEQLARWAPTQGSSQPDGAGEDGPAQIDVAVFYEGPLTFKSPGSWPVVFRFGTGSRWMRTRILQVHVADGRKP